MDHVSVPLVVTQAEPEKVHPFVGTVFHVDKFNGISQGAWKVGWKANLNRLVVLVVGSEPKDGWNPLFDLDAALAKLGYVKAPIIDETESSPIDTEACPL